MKLETLQEAIAAHRKQYLKAATQAGVSYAVLAEEPTAEALDSALSIRNEDDHMIVRVQGPIDAWYGCDVREIIRRLDKEKPKSIHLLVDSPGGFLFDGMSLYNDLRARARDNCKITVEARGLVASAAVLPFLAGEDRAMSEGTQLMVHEPWSCMISCGTAEDIRSDAESVAKPLEKSNEVMAKIYVSRTGLTMNKVRALLSEETWFTSEEAMDSGFATELSDAPSDEQPDPESLAAAQAILTLNRNRFRGGNHHAA